MATAIKKLTATEIAKHLKKLPDWVSNAKKTEISKTIPTHSFLSGLSTIARIAVHAEILGHHPDIELSYTSVKIRISTHDVKGLTKLDFDLAKRIDLLQAK